MPDRGQTRGIRLKFTAETEGVTSQIRRLRSDARSLDTQFRNLSSAMKLDPTNLKNYTSGLNVLNDRIKDQEALVEKLQEKLAVANKYYGEGSTTTQSYANQLEVAKSKLTQLNAQQKNFVAEQGNAISAMQATKEQLSTLSIAMGALAARGLAMLISKTKELAQAAIETGETYQDSIHALAAVMEQTADSEQITDLSDRFRELALNSRYSASEMADNAAILANAGYSYQQISDAIVPIQNLAEGTGESFESMANIVADGLHAFGMEAKDATHFSDVLAKAAISSNTNVSQMGEAFKYAGTVAGSFGYNIEDVAVALGTMASAGIKGTQAGTSFRSMVTRLGANTSGARDALEELGVSFYDSEGKARPLIDVLDDMRGAMSGLTQEQKVQLEYVIAGQRGITGLAAIVNASTEDWDNLKNAVADYDGTVAQMKETRIDTLSGDVEKLKHSWQELAIELFEDVSPELRRIVKHLTEVAQSDAFKMSVTRHVKNIAKALEVLNNVGDGTVDTITEIGKLLAGLAFTSLLNKGVSSLAKFASGLGALSQQFVYLGTAISSAAPWLTLISLGITGVVTATGALKDAFVRAHPQIEKFNQENEELYKSLEDSKEAFSDSIDAALSEYDSNERLITQLSQFVDANGNVKEGYEDRVNYIMNQLSSAYGVEGELIDGRISDYDAYIQKLRETSEEQAKLAIIEAAQEQVNDAEQARYDALQQQTDAYTELYHEAKKYLDLLGNNSDYQYYVMQNAGFMGTVEDWQALTEAQKINWLMTTDVNYATKEAKQNILDAGQAVSDTTTNLQAAQEMLGTVYAGSLEDARMAVAQFASETSQQYGTTLEALLAYAAQYQALSDTFQTASDDQKLIIAQSMQEIAQQFYNLKDELGDEANGITLSENTEANMLVGQQAVDAVKAGAETAASTSGASVSDTMYSSMSASNAVNQETAVAEAMEDGAELGTAFTGSEAESLDLGQESVTSSADDIATGVVDITETTMSKDKAFSVGSNWVQGLINGLKSKQKELEDTINTIANLANKITTKTNQIGSPSKTARRLGAYWGEGFKLGLEDSEGTISKQVNKMNSVLNNAMTAGAYGIAGTSYAARSTTVNQNLTFNGNYQARDGLAVVRDLDRRLGLDAS